MKKITLGVAILIGIGLNACMNGEKNSSQPTADTTAMKMKNDLKNLVSIVEIPTTDFSRAVTFYQAILDIKIEPAEMDGIKMGMFPGSGDGVFVQLIHGSDYKPSADGTIVYLNGGNDLQHVADKIKAMGGQIIVPKTEISPEIGHFAIFLDTEGNKIGLHSLH
jgi:uncharacterized protein